MGLRARYVLGRELAVEGNGSVDLLHNVGRPGSEAAAPHLVAHAPLLDPLRMTEDKPARRRRLAPFAAALVVIALAAGVLYERAPGGSKDAAALCPAAKAAAARLGPLAH